MSEKPAHPLEVENALLKHELQCRSEIDKRFEKVSDTFAEASKTLSEVTTSFKAQEERLRAGAEKFTDHSQKIEALDVKVHDLEIKWTKIAVVVGILASGGVAGWKLFGG